MSADVWTLAEVQTLDQLARVCGDRAERFELLAADVRADSWESAAYTSGASYGFRMAQAAILDLVASRPQVHRFTVRRQDGINPHPGVLCVKCGAPRSRPWHEVSRG